MAKIIFPRPALLLAKMHTMTAALTKYAETFVPSSPTKVDLESSISELTLSLQTQVRAAGEAEKATKDLYASRDKAVDVVRRMRDAVYAYFGKSDPRIVEFGLDTLKARRSAKSGNGSKESTVPQ